jgi:DNA-binding MarR family transcriptional regulator
MHLIYVNIIDMNDEDRPLGYLLHRLNARLRIEVTTSVLDPLGLSFPQYICMRVLSHSPGRSNAELARDLEVSPQAMNMVVRGLQERGLVSRPTSVASGRSLPAELTREGAAVMARAEVDVRAAEQKALAPLSAADQHHLRTLLGRVG